MPKIQLSEYNFRAGLVSVHGTGRKEAGVKLVTGFESQLPNFAEITSLGNLISVVGIIIRICSQRI